MRKLKITLSLMLLFTILTINAAAEELVIKIEIDQSSLSSLDTNAKTYLSSAYSRFLQDILSLPQISVRNSSVDENLQAIQLKSQIEAATGMGSEEAAYATDKGSRAELSLLMKMNKITSSSWQVTVQLSEIETKKLVATILTDRLPLTSVTSDLTIDKLAYDTLLAMQNRSYISSIPSSLITQLQHQESSAEAYAKYLQDYTNQIEEIEKEKALLEKNAKTKEEKAEAERQALALQLKIDMLEKSRQQAEAALKRQQEIEANEAKKKQQMEELSQAQQDQINKEIKELEKKRAELRDSVIQQMSLKKRIELIENDKTNLYQLEKLLSQSITKIQNEYDSACEEKVRAKNNEPWSKGETDANGNPTAMAKKFRAQDIDEIKKNYQKLKTNAVNELKKSAEGELISYKKQIELNVSELQKTTYVFRSIDLSDDYLTLNVDDYDGNNCSWTVHSRFTVRDIEKLDTSKLKYLPDSEISYFVMTGKKPATFDSTKEEYLDYLAMVERADLYFRVSVPYLYSQLAIKVTYNPVKDKYEAVPEYFHIYKMENNTKALVDFRGAYFTNAQKQMQNEAEAAQKKEEEEEKAEQKKKAAEERAKIKAAAEERKKQIAKKNREDLENFGRTVYLTSEIAYNKYTNDLTFTVGFTQPVIGPFYAGAELFAGQDLQHKDSYGEEIFTLGAVGYLGFNCLLDKSEDLGWYIRSGVGGALDYACGSGLLYRTEIGIRCSIFGLAYSIDHIQNQDSAGRLSVSMIIPF